MMTTTELVAAAQRLRVENVESNIYRLHLHSDRLDEGLFLEASRALDELAKRSDLKVLILDGEEDVFSAGASLTFLRKLSAGQVQERAWWALPDKLLSFPVPIIAAVSGHAVGGGLMVALCCDMLVGANESRYGFNFVELGFTPGMGATWLLPRVVGTAFAAEMLMTGKLYRGSELGNRALFNNIVPRAEVARVALDLARRVAEKPAHVLGMLKETLAAPRRSGLLEAIREESLMHSICFSKAETRMRIEERYLNSDDVACSIGAPATAHSMKGKSNAYTR